MADPHVPELSSSDGLTIYYSHKHIAKVHSLLSPPPPRNSCHPNFTCRRLIDWLVWSGERSENTYIHTQLTQTI